jgi:hypothetical protein
MTLLFCAPSTAVTLQSTYRVKNKVLLVNVVLVLLAAIRLATSVLAHDVAYIMYDSDEGESNNLEFIPSSVCRVHVSGH